MRRGILALSAAVLLLAAAGLAGGFSHTYSLATGTVVLSNSQANSSWAPVAVMFGYAEACTGTAEVRRVSQGMTLVLASCSFTNVSSLVWVPDCSYSFGYGDELVIVSSVTSGFVQVTRRGD